MNNETLQEIAIQLEYDFDDIRILRQAFTRKSYSEEHNGEHHNEVLEFYGDKVLEFVVMKKLSEYYGRITQNGKYASEKTEGQLTEVKKKLVCKKMLAHRIDVLGFAEYILMGKGDIGKKVQNQDSVKEDLFEAIIGAVAIDCGWDIDVLEDMIIRMLDVEHYLEHGFSDDENYVDLIQTWCQKRYGWIPEYDFNETDDGYECSLTLSDDYDDFIGCGYSKRAARMDAAQCAYEYLENNDELLLPSDEVGVPEIDRAINQLQELYQKGYINEPYYEFYEEHDDNGNSIWQCECHIRGEDEYYWINASSKKEGKKKAAYDMLCDVLERGN